MRIGILTQYYVPEIGAPQARLSDIAMKLVDRGHEVFVLTAMPNYPRGQIYPGYGGFFCREMRDGVSVIRTYIYPSKSIGLIRRLANYFSFVLSSLIAGTIVLPRLDYLLTESPPLFLGITGYLLSRLKRARWIFNVSDLWPESAVRIGVLRRESLAYRLSEKLEAFCYRNSWIVTGQSKGILASIQERFPICPVFHLSNGVDSQRFNPERQTATARAALGNDDQCVALYAGLHGVAQGLDQVLLTADALRSESQLRFVLIGDGPEKEKLRDQVTARKLNNVCFLNPYPADEIPALLAAADVVLVPLKSYIPGAVPSKLYEAMASGRPVVLVASGEAADIVHEHQAGLAIDPGDVSELTEALKTLRDQPQLRWRLGMNGRRAAEQYFDRGKIVARFIACLETNL